MGEFTDDILSQGDISIWEIKHNPPYTLGERYTRVLSAFERARADTFRSGELRNRFLRTHFGLRSILGCYLRCEPSEIRYGYGAHGKPYILYPDPDGLQFNITYSQDLALIALVRGNPIGIDLEYIKDIPEASQLAERYFSAQEFRQYCQMKAGDQINAFYRCWTRKEALVKALGGGLSIALSSFSVSLLPQEAARITRLDCDSAAPGRWQIEDLSSQTTGYAAAVAVRGKITGQKTWLWDEVLEKSDNGKYGKSPPHVFGDFTCRTGLLRSSPFGRSARFVVYATRQPAIYRLQRDACDPGSDEH